MIKKLLLTFTFCFLALAGTHHVLAQTNCDPSKGYCLLAPIPVDGDTNTVANQVDIAHYVPNAVKLIIALATGLAVLMIIYGGFQYIASTIPNVKTNGKEMINNALIGLLLITASYSILYTLNPKLVNLSLSIEQLKDAPAISTDLAATASSTSTTNGTPSVGTGAPVGSNNCGTSCKDAQSYSFPKKGPGGGCQGSTCLIDPALADDLVLINGKLGSSFWTVTEMTPPTVNHSDHCHSNGTCVDASLTNATVDNIVKLFQTLDSASGGISGLSGYEYETCNTGILNALRTDPKLANWKDKIKCEPTTQNGSSGQSFHIEGPNANDLSFGAGTTATP